MEEQIVINKTERPNSYEFGKAGNRFKLYFDTAEDLKQQIDNLIRQGLYLDETNKSEEVK
jgi:hypothetical protein